MACSAWDVDCTDAVSEAVAVLPHLNYESANVLLVAIISVWGAAYLFRMAIRLMFNKY